MYSISFKGPKYLEKFHCIGPDCEQTCCTGWTIDLDKETFKRYQKFKNWEFNGDFKRYFKKKFLPTRNAVSYGVLDLTKTKFCPFFTDKKLCAIHLKYGPEYLSLICDSYPRITNSIDDNYERCLTLSCPEAARIVLFNNEKFEIKTYEESSKNRICINRTFKTDKATFFNKSKKHFYLLRDYSVNLLKDESFELWERLMILANFYTGIEQLVIKKKIDQIPKFTEKSKNAGYNELLKKSANAAYEHEEKKIVILVELFTKMKVKSKALKDYEEVYDSVEKAFDLENGINYKTINKIYNDSYSKYYQPFFSKNKHVLENYLLNHIYRDLFPFIAPTSAHQSLIILLVQYSIIKFHLLGYASHNKRLTKEDIVKVVYSFHRVFTHYTPFYINLVKFMKFNRLDNLKYLACLIKE